ncbi:UNVERIFIED_CONTAM: hypothetical protein FKN15_055939 [Acipenser sinensis]
MYFAHANRKCISVGQSLSDQPPAAVLCLCSSRPIESYGDTSIGQSGDCPSEQG